MSSVLTTKLRRDLRATWSRFVLMVVAITVSLMVFSGVLFSFGASSRETEAAYLSTEPASATILLDRSVNEAQMAAIVDAARDRPGVLEATGRTQFTSKVLVDAGWLANSLQVFVTPPDDELRVARFEVTEGSWPPAPGEIMLDRDSFTLLGVAIGDVMSVETPSGERASLRVAGVVYDPSLAPAPQEQRGHGYLATTSLPKSDLDQLKIQVAEPGQTEPSRNRDAITATARDVGEWLKQQYGVPIREIQVPEPYAHPHQGQANALLLSLLAGGAIALLLSTILVATMLNGLFTQQIPQIGILKAVGARSGRIARFYLTMTFVVAAAATLIALPLGIAIGRTATTKVLGFLGIQSTDVTPPWWTYAVVLAAGLLLPPLMALPPLIKTSRTTVRQAIDHRGLSSSPQAATSVLARFGRLPGMDRGLLMALRNTIRRPARFLLSVTLLASAGMVFVAGISTGDGLKTLTADAKTQRTWDVEVALDKPASADQLTAIVGQLPNVSRVEAWTVAKAGVAGPQQIPVSRTYPDQGHGGVSVTAIPSDSTMFSPPKLLEGRWLKSGETGAIVLNQIARATTVPDIRPGDTVQLFVSGRPTTWRVAGIAEEKGGGAGGTYVTAEGLAATGAGSIQANTLRVATDRHDEQTRTAVAGAVETALGNAGVDVRSAASVSISDAAAEGHTGPIIAIVVIIAIAMGVIGCIGLASTMSANILERTREFGIMHAVGAQPKTVRRIVAAEGVFMAVASALAAIVPALGLTAIMGAGLGELFMYTALPYRISYLAIGIWIVVVVMGAILATEAAASRASRLTVREALAYL